MLDNLRTGLLSEHELLRFHHAARDLEQSASHIVATIGWELSALRLRALTLMQHYGQLGMVVIDSFEYLTIARESMSQIGNQGNDAMRSCALMAKQLKCPVLVLLRIPETIKIRGDPRPHFYDLPIEAEALKLAQTILAIYRDDQYSGGSSLEPGIAEIKVLRNRFGLSSTVKLAFLQRIAKYESLAKTYD